MEIIEKMLKIYANRYIKKMKVKEGHYIFCRVTNRGYGLLFHFFQMKYQQEEWDVINYECGLTKEEYDEIIPIEKYYKIKVKQHEAN